MKISGCDVPEPKKENAKAIIELAQRLHIGRRKNIKWNQYWVEAYQKVLEALNEGNF